jgi:uncharacterized protein (DUF983 family)
MIIGLALAYFSVCVVGHFVVAAAMSGMRRLVFKRWPVFCDWSIFFLGTAERAIALTLVLWATVFADVRRRMGVAQVRIGLAAREEQQ